MIFNWIDNEEIPFYYILIEPIDFFRQLICAKNDEPNFQFYFFIFLKMFLIRLSLFSLSASFSIAKQASDDDVVLDSQNKMQK